MHYCEDPYVFAQFVLQKEAFELSLFDDPDHLLRCLLWRHQLFTHHGPVQSLTKVKPNHSTCTIISSTNNAIQYLSKIDALMRSMGSTIFTFRTKIINGLLKSHNDFTKYLKNKSKTIIKDRYTDTFAL